MDGLRDLRTKEKFPVDDYYINYYARRLDPHATAVYLSLCRHADKNQRSFPGLEKMAEQHNIGIATVSRKIQLLADHNLICKRQEKDASGRFTKNVYYLMDKSRWKLYRLSQEQTVAFPPFITDEKNRLSQEQTKGTQEKKDTQGGNAVAKELLNGKVETFWRYFILKTKRGFKLTPVSRNLITERLSSYKLEELKKCVDTFVNDEWSGRKDHLDLIYCIGHQKGKPDAVEKWLNKTPKSTVRYV